MTLYPDKISRCFILSILLLPILFQYLTPIEPINLGDAFLIIAAFIYTLNIPFKIESPIVFIILYIIIITTNCYLLSHIPKYSTTLHYLAYLFVILIMPKLSKYKDYIFEMYRKVSLISATLLIVQTLLLKTIGYCLPGVLTFLPLTDPSMQDYTAAVLYTNSGRCMSFYGEPSHYGIYVLPFLIITFFANSFVTRKGLIEAAYVSISLILCSSFTGVISAIIIWSIYLIFNIIRGKFSLSIVFLCIFSFGIFLFILLNSSAGEYMFNDEIIERQSGMRFEGFEALEMIIDNKGSSFLYWGNGMNDIGEFVYLSGWPRLLYYFGVIGSLIYIYCIASCARKRTVSIILLFLMGILMVGTEMNFGIYFVVYMLLMFATRNIPLSFKNRM